VIQKSNAFSLVEVVLAIAVISFALVAILGLIPVGSKSGRDSIDSTRITQIAQEVYQRVRANMVSNDATSTSYFAPYAANSASFFYFDSQGGRTGQLLRSPYTGDAPQNYTTVKTTSDFYRARARVALLDQTASYSTRDPRRQTGTTVPRLLCVTVDVGWPVSTQDGSVFAGTSHGVRASYTFLLRKP
jgi:uncharacterized protein (TIGR02598 family)